MYLLALGIAGAAPVEPAPATAETPDKSTEYVVVPLDVLFKYLLRAERLAMELPERVRLSHITNLDRSERAEWSRDSQQAPQLWVLSF